MAEESAARIEIEIVYALPDEQFTQTLRVERGTTIEQAIEQSGFLLRYPGMAMDPTNVGIYGRRADPSTVLREFDRVEIYRPLIADPKQARRARSRPKKLGR